MIEVLKEWGVPGGLLSILLGALIQQIRRPSDAAKTPTADVHRAEAAQVARDTGLEDKWREWAERVEAETKEQLSAALVELKQARADLARATGINNTLTGYAWQLRADITTYGHTPRPWPESIDPERRDDMRTREATA